MQVIRAALIVAALGGSAHANGSACIPAKHSHHGSEVTIAGGRVQYCSVQGPTCLTLDAANLWSPAPVVKRVAAAKPALFAKITMSTTATLCAANHTDCHSFSTAYAPMDEDLGVHVITNADRSVVVVGHDDGIVIFDGRTGAQRGTIAYWDREQMPNLSMAFAGDHILVWGTNGSTGVARLYDADAKVVADLGAVEDPYLVLDNGVLAYLTAQATDVAIRDRTGKLLHTTPLPAPLQKLVSINLFAVVPATKQLVVVNRDSIALVDPQTGALTVVPPPPTCP